MKKLIIIPAYNEEENIEATIEQIEKAAPDFDYIIINDCSKDRTEAICMERGFSFISLPINLGIGGAVQTGYRYAKEKGYDLAVQVDGDGQHNPAYLDDLAKELLDKDWDMVIGSRFIENIGFQSSFVRRLGIKYFTFLLKILTGTTITDPTSGLRMVNRQVIELFAKEYPEDYPEPESVVAILRQKRKVTELPVIMNAREKGVSSITPRRSIYYMLKVTLAILIDIIRKKN